METLSLKEVNEIFEYRWATGNLRGLLYDHQFAIYDLFQGQENMTTVFHCARRLGKSAVDALILLETCLQRNGAICRFASATQESVKEIVLPMIAKLCETAPAHLKPYYHSSGRFLFPHRPNSQLVIAGIDMHSDRLRGPACDNFVIDEASFVRHLEEVIKDIVMPQFLTTKGRLILSSTSPKTPAHPFVDRMERAKEEKAYIKMTIHQDSRPEVLARIPLFMKEAGGIDSTTWRREYLCEIIVDEDYALVPEFSRPEIRSRCHELPEIPAYFIAYTVIDLGYIDNAAAVFGYVDFRNGKRVVVDELLLNRKNSKEIADAIFAKEQEIWGPEKTRQHPLRRYADGQPLTIADFNDIHHCSVTKVSEDTPEAKVNQVRLDVQQGRLKISPKCKLLIRELHYGIWNDQHTNFARVEGTFGHFDLLASLTYFCRHTNLNENPYPVDFDFHLDTMARSEKYRKPEPEIATALKSIFRI